MAIIYLINHSTSKLFNKVGCIGISTLGTRMNTDYQDIKSYKKQNICANLCPNLTCQRSRKQCTFWVPTS